MDLHQPPKNKRFHTHLGGDVSSSALPSHHSFVDPEFASLPHHLSILPDQVATFPYASSSGLQIHHDPYSYLQYSRKRQRLDSNDMPVSQGEASSSAAGDDEKSRVPILCEQHGYGETSSSARWLATGTSYSPSLGSPLIKRMAELGLLLCPCCGFDWEQSDGYHPVSAAPLMCDETKPYTVERPPSMQASTSNQYSPVNVETRQQVSFDGDQSSVATNFPGYAVQDHLSAPVQPISTSDGAYQQSGLGPEYYPNLSNLYVGQESHLLNTSMMPPEVPARNDQAPMQCGQNMFGVSRPVPLQHQLIGQVEAPSEGSMVPTREPFDSKSLDVWCHGSPQDTPSNFDILLPNQRGGKRGPFRDPNLREQTAQTRKIGSCIRCRMQRIRCENNPDEPGSACLTCKKVANTKAGRFPCLRYKITDIRMFKPGQVPGYEWTRRWSNNISDPIQRWASSDIKVVRISDGYSKKCVELRVRQFVPQDGDKLERTWDYQGTKKSVVIPPYALMDLEDGKMAYTTHIRDSMADTFRSVLGRPDGLLYKTYLRAWQLCRDPSTPTESLDLLNWTLRLWTSIRLSTTSGFIVGDETLGMAADILDETSPSPGKIPVPPVLGAQLDLILIHHIQTRLRRELLDKLQRMILKNKQSSWLVTYLVSFILLHNTALITAHDARYARKHGMKRLFAREDKVKEYHLGANILLAHFHYCNKGVHPFSDECKDQDLRTLADLDDEQIQFVHATRSYAKRHKREWAQLQERRDFEDDYYFVSQLFDENWQPGSTA